jgi:hypothetical protein
MDALNQDEIKQLQTLLDRASASKQIRIVDPTQVEFAFDFVMRENKDRALKLTIDWRAEGELPEVAKIAVRRVQQGLRPEPFSFERPRR